VQALINDLLATTAGYWAVSVKDFVSGRAYSVNGNQAFNAASVIKLPILIELYRQADAGRLRLEDRLELPEAEKVPGSGVLKELGAGLALSLRDLAVLMVVLSDNTATNLLIDTVGIEAVNRALTALGCRHSHLRRKLFHPLPGVTNEVAADDMILLLEHLYRETAASPEACREMLAILGRQQYREKIPRYLPKSVAVAHKTGEVSGVTHDVGIVTGPGVTFAIACLSAGLPAGHQGNEFIGRLARTAYDFLAGRCG
jgi:beta-lactamase class A